MEKRKFGRINSKVSVIALGGAGLGEATQEESDRAFKKAMEAGVNMIDVAPSYKDAENKIAHFVKEYRDNFFLAEKTMERTKEGAKKELEESLKRLGTDHFDLYQFHAVKTFTELGTIFGKGGAMEAFQEAKEQGIIKYIGLTGHDNIQIHLKALEVYDFDVLLLPVNITSIITPHPVNDYRAVLEQAVKKNVGITAIKAIQERRWREGEKKYSCWYKPFEDQEAITDTVHYTLSQEGVTTYSLAGDTRLWDMILEAGKTFKKLDKTAQDDLVKKYSQLQTAPLFPKM